MKFRIRNAEKIVVLFVLTIVFLTLSGIIVTGINQQWFSPNFTFKLNISSAIGIERGKSILMNGFKIGKVTKLKLMKDNSVDCEIKIFSDFIDKVTKYSLIDIFNPILQIGTGSQLLFYPGNSKEVLPNGSYIPLTSSNEGQGIIKAKLNNIDIKPDNISLLLSTLTPTLETTGKTITEVKNLVEEINSSIKGESSGALGLTFKNLSASMNSVKEITANLERTSETFKDSKGLLKNLIDPKGSLKTLFDDNNILFNSLSSSMDELSLAIKSISNLSNSLNQALPTIDESLADAGEAISNAKDVLEGLKNNPLLSGGISKKNTSDERYKSIRFGDLKIE